MQCVTSAVWVKLRRMLKLFQHFTNISIGMPMVIMRWKGEVDRCIETGGKEVKWESAQFLSVFVKFISVSTVLMASQMMRLL
jgi:hypothetical protein